MTAVLELAPLEKMRDYVERGLLKCQEHPTLPLTIWNYTPECQYSRSWDDVTTQCRGLITDDKGRIVARPFGKFFNLEEYVQMGHAIPDESFWITEKLDGSLIIITVWENRIIVASRGSFTSPQAAWATELYQASDGPMLDPADTYCFELIHPGNRIVVDYGNRKELVLVATIHTTTGVDVINRDVGFPLVREIEHAGGFRDLPQEPNEEGYVILFESGLRLKVKNEEYVRLHKLLTQTAAKTVWEAIRDGKMIGLLDRVPDEFYQWVRGTELDLERKASALQNEAAQAFSALDRGQSRKELAMQIQQERRPIQPLLFLMLDGKDPMPLIWKMVKPQAGDYPFRSIPEDEA